MSKQLTVSNKAKASTHAKSNHDQREMIACEAYLLAEKRGFNGGDPIQDWLEAEKKVGDMFTMND